MRNYCRFGHSATMSRTFSLLSLILFTIGFTPDPGSAVPEPIRVDSGLLFHNREYQKELEAEGFEEAQRRLFHEDESPSELVGNWRDNGEALEPKWRDGDTVPLLPFSEYSRYSRDQLANLEQTSDRRKDHRPRGPSRIPHPEHYEWLDDRFDYIEREQAFHQRRNNKGNSYRQPSVFLDKERDTSLKDITSPRYRETFQARPSDYGQELDDEEYLKPRPRKRRPPQNYEFALAANEASLREKKAEDRKIQSRMNGRNAAELKSLLKMQQEEGLSLSELLQRRNLTLNDLLGGKEEVISALKAKDEDFDDYVDRVEKVMSNSFGKIFTTPKPTWSTSLQQELEVAREKGQLPKISTTEKPARQMTVDVPSRNITESVRITVSTETSTRKHGNKFTTVEPVVVSSSEENASTLTSFSSATTLNASSMPLDVAETTRNKTSDAKSRNREVKFDGFDEDEIMEFSDMPDFKEGRQGGSPMWVAMQVETKRKSPAKTEQNVSSDSVSTLSIEQVLNPAQDTKSRDPSVERLKELEGDVTIIKLEKPWTEEEPISIGKNGNQDKMMENDYQDDGSMTFHGSVYTTQTYVDDGERSGETVMENIPSDLPQRSQGKPENHNADGKEKYEDIVSETESEARAEIFELFASTSAAKRLERLLKSRNMSIDELIALRQRGSSKIHLAEASRLRAQKSNIATETNSRDNIDNTTPPKYQEPDESIRHVNKEIEKILQKSSIQTANPESVNSDSVGKTGDTTNTPINGELNILNEQETLNRLKQNAPQRMYEIVDLLTTFASLPFAKDIQRELAPTFSEDEETEKKLITGTNTNDSFPTNTATSTPTTNSPDLVESKYIEEIVKQEANAVNSVFRETEILAGKESNRVEEKRNISRVKPSIIASAAILGITTVVFLTIFIVCKVRQKQKYRYRNTFSRAVFQGPMMAARKLSNSSSLSNVMVNVVATSTTKRAERHEIPDHTLETDPRSDIDSDSLDATDSWETIPDYMK